MLCRKCGAELDSQVKICPVCRTPVIGTDEEFLDDPLFVGTQATEPQEPLPSEAYAYAESEGEGSVRGHSRRFGIKTIALILGVVLLVGAAAGAVSWLLWYISPRQRALRALHAENYAAAVHIAEQSPELAEDREIEAILLDCISSLRAAYLSGEQDSAAVLELLDTLKPYGSNAVQTALSEAEDLVRRIDASRAAFAEGEEALNAGDYRSAMAFFAAVDAEDPAYAEAGEKAAQANELLRREYLAQALAAANREDYETAMDILHSALEEYPEDAEILSALEQYQAAIPQREMAKGLAQAKLLAENGDLPGAVRLLDSLIDTYGEDDALLYERRQYTGRIVDQVLEKVNKAIAERRYDRAEAALLEGLEQIPDNPTLLNWLSDVEQAMPTSAAEVRLIRCDRNWTAAEDCGDLFDDPLNVYSANANSYAEFESTGFGLVTGTVLCAEDMPENANCVFEVYLNSGKEPAFRSEELKIGSDPLDFQVILPDNTENIRLVCHVEGRGAAHIYIANLLFWPAGG